MLICLTTALSSDVEEKLLMMLRRLNLNYGAFDLILTPEGKYVFLELNPNGQYLWIEHLTKLPISEAIADLLIKGTTQIRP